MWFVISLAAFAVFMGAGNAYGSFSELDKELGKEAPQSDVSRERARLAIRRSIFAFIAPVAFVTWLATLAWGIFGGPL